MEMKDVALNAKELRKQAKNMLDEAVEVERREATTKSAKETAFALVTLRNSLMEAGFEEYEAYELVCKIVDLGGMK